MGFRGALVGGFRKDDVLDYIEEAAKERSTLQEQLDAALEEKKSLDADRSALAAVVEQLNAQLEEMDELRNELEQLQNENDELREREAEAQQAALMAEQMMGTLQMNIDKLEEEVGALEREKHALQEECARMKAERALYAEIEVEARTRAAQTEAAAEEKIAGMYAETDKLLEQVLACLLDAAADSRSAARQAADRTQVAEQNIDEMMRTIDAQVLRMRGELPGVQTEAAEGAEAVEAEAVEAEAAGAEEDAVVIEPAAPAEPAEKRVNEQKNSISELLRQLRRKL